jgi:uncharacterized protein YdaU (DUF1376 family)
VSVEKSPSFQWYPRDYLVDELTVVMSLEEEGAYRRLMDYCWLEGSLPDDLGALAVMCKGVTRKRMEKLWEKIKPCFRLKADRWRHPRLDRERRRQLANKKARSSAGKKGAEAKHRKGKRGTATVLPLANSSLAVAVASSTSVNNSSEFDEVWQTCPGRGSKAKALAEYSKAVPAKVDHATLLTAWKRHVAAASELRFVKHLERWIRDERWAEFTGSSNGSKPAEHWASTL